MAQYDLIYNGNVQNWVKLANSLMLRIAVRVHFIDETLAKEYITKALDPKNGGVIEDISSEAKIKSSDKMPLLNSMLASVNEYNETRMGATIWGYLDGYKDPRLSAYFTEGHMVLAVGRKQVIFRLHRRIVNLNRKPHILQICIASESRFQFSFILVQSIRNLFSESRSCSIQFDRW
ncbi:Susd and RagB outer membrane lipoprotein [Bacteroides thetaiotaomicron]|nr:Susd and RagB outer membrane lipoprotein [Bacteroides thetaiotaomicron]